MRGKGKGFFRICKQIEEKITEKLNNRKGTRGRNLVFITKQAGSLRVGRNHTPIKQPSGFYTAINSFPKACNASLICAFRSSLGFLMP